MIDTIDIADIMSRLPSDREGSSASPDLLEKRSSFGPSEPVASVAAHDTVIGDVPCRVFDGPAQVTVLYLHGGGYRMGSAAAYTAYASRISAATESTVVVPDYRLAPENPFPAAVRDAFRVYLELRRQHPGRPVVVAGDSAGGGLAAAISVAATATGVTRPDGQALLSPWIDLRCDAATFGTATDLLFDHSTALDAQASYLQAHETDDPLVSPVRADPAHFPRTLVQVGTTESLLDDSLSFSRHLATAGVSCELHVVADQGHTWPVITPDHPDSLSALRVMNRFIEQVIAEFGR